AFLANAKRYENTFASEAHTRGSSHSSRIGVSWMHGTSTSRLPLKLRYANGVLRMTLPLFASSPRWRLSRPSKTVGLGTRVGVPRRGYALHVCGGGLPSAECFATMRR